jgi:CheY-like chemotaxis protein
MKPSGGDAVHMRPAYHVIIADDDAAIRSLVARIVVRTYDPVAISAVADGLDALIIYQQQGADLVITNHEMPVLSGLSLTERLRVLSATLPIIMISASPSVEPLARAVGVTAFLVKPFLITQLVQVLTSVLPP